VTHQALAAAIASISISHSGLTRALTMIVAEPGRASPKCFARAAPAAATSSGRTREDLNKGMELGEGA
jgi:hypothetical protein